MNLQAVVLTKQSGGGGKPCMTWLPESDVQVCDDSGELQLLNLCNLALILQPHLLHVLQSTYITEEVCAIFSTRLDLCFQSNFILRTCSSDMYYFSFEV